VAPTWRAVCGRIDGLGLHPRHRQSGGLSAGTPGRLVSMQLHQLPMSRVGHCGTSMARCSRGRRNNGHGRRRRNNALHLQAQAQALAYCKDHSRLLSCISHASLYHILHVSSINTNSHYLTVVKHNLKFAPPPIMSVIFEVLKNILYKVSKIVYCLPPHQTSHSTTGFELKARR
jgi:hypothetical protein